jgi:tRNA nucleotidyltransferase (CCA-adding enzyme)
LGDADRRDIDLEVYGLCPDTLEALLARFGHVRRVGRSFPVLLLPELGLDVSLPRPRPPFRSRSMAVSAGDPWAGFDSDQGFDQSFDQGFDQASLARDLRVNAMGWDPLSEELLDPHDGLADLSARRLRATCPDRFGEDPLRGLRTAQLAARLEFVPDSELLGLCAMVDLSDIPGERLLDEFRKLLLLARLPSQALAILRETQLLRFFPQLEALCGVAQEPTWHPEGDVFTHTLRVVDEAARERTGDAFDDQALMFGALCHDFGKATTTELRDGRVVSRGHSRAGVEPTQALLARLRAPKALTAAVSALVLHHLAPAEFVKPGGAEAGPRAYRRLARALRAQRVDFELLLRLARADFLGKSAQSPTRREFPAGAVFLERARSIEAQASTHVEIVKGRHVLARGFEPGPAVGALLARCRAIQDDTGWSEPDKILSCALAQGLE